MSTNIIIDALGMGLQHISICAPDTTVEGAAL